MNINTIRRIIADNEMLKDGIAAAAKDSVKAMKLIRERGDEIKELEDKLEAEDDKNRRLRYKIAYNPCRGLQEEIWELKDAIVEKNDKIKELEAKLAVYDPSKQEATGLNFDGVDDCIEILPRHIIDEADIPKSKWVRIISAYGMGEDITVIHDADADKDHIYDAFCSVECPLCSSRKIVVMIEGNIADREQHFNALDSAIDRTRELLHIAMDHIQTQNDEIAKITEQRDNEAGNRRRVAKHLQHCIGERDATIEELNAELAARNEDSIMLIKVVQLIKLWEECHNVKYIHRIHTAIEDYINTKKEERT